MWGENQCQEFRASEIQLAVEPNIINIFCMPGF